MEHLVNSLVRFKDFVRCERVRATGEVNFGCWFGGIFLFYSGQDLVFEIEVYFTERIESFFRRGQEVKIRIEDNIYSVSKKSYLHTKINF